MGVEDKLYGGKIDTLTEKKNFEDSMAEEIENAYAAVLAENGKAPLPSANPEDRRMLFIAISRGVINHLAKKHMAITVKLPDTPAGQTVPVEIGKR